MEGIERAFVYGSWAARYLGERGNDPADVDALVVGNPGRRELRRAASEATDRLGRDVNVERISVDTWKQKDDPFVSRLSERPLVELDLARSW